MNTTEDTPKTLRFCPYCGAAVDPNLGKFCPSCGSKLILPESKPQVAQATVQEEAAETLPAASTVSEPVAPADAEDSPAAEEAPAVEAEPAADDIETPTAEAEAPVEEEKAEEGAGIPFFKRIPLKWLIAGIAALAAVIVLIVVLVILLAGPKSVFKEPEAYMEAMYHAEDSQIYIIRNNQILDDGIDAYLDDQARSIDGSTLAIYADGNLYTYADGKLTKAAKEVESYFLLAPYGDYLVYCTVDDQLMYYDIARDTAALIVDMDEDTVGRYICISPDGKTVAYDENDALRIYQNGESERFGRDMSPLAITDNAELVYYIDHDSNDIYVGKGDEDAVKIGAAEDYTMYFNADHTELVLQSGSNVYLVANGGERKKLSNDGLRNVLRHWGNNMSYVAENKVTLPLETFVGMYYLTEDGELCYINDSYESETLLDKNVADFCMSKDGKFLYYRDESGKLYRGKGGGQTDSFVRIDKDVKSFAITSDGKGCYYTNEDDKFLYAEKNSAGQIISSDVNDFFLSHDDYAFFREKVSSDGGSLYYSYRGGAKVRVDEDVYDFLVFPTATYYFKYDEDGGIIYATSEKADFTKLINNLPIGNSEGPSESAGETEPVAESGEATEADAETSVW